MLYAFDEALDRQIVPRRGVRGAAGDPATIVNPPPRSIIDECADLAIKSVSYNPKDYARMLAQVKAWTGPWMLTTAGECNSKAGSTAATVTDYTSYAASFIPVVGWIASGALSIFSAFRAKHAQAVARENSVLCQAATESNKVLADLDNLYRSGQITNAQAVGVLDILVGEYRKAVSPIAKQGNASQWKLAQCISLCEHRKRFEYRTEQPLGSPANPVTAPKAAAPQKNAATPTASAPAPSGKSTLAVVGAGAVLIFGVLALA
jgi:hypothetical protein